MKDTTTTILDTNLELLKHPTDKVMNNKLKMPGLKALLKVVNKVAKETGECESLDGRPTIAVNMDVLYNLMPTSYQKKHADNPTFVTRTFPNLLRLASLCGAIQLLDWTQISKDARDARYKLAMASMCKKKNDKAAGHWYMQYKNVYAINDFSQPLHWERLSYKMNEQTKLTYGAVATMYDLEVASDIFTGVNSDHSVATMTENQVGKLVTQLSKVKVMTLDDTKPFIRPNTKDNKDRADDWYRNQLNCLDILGYFKANNVAYDMYCKCSDYVDIDAKANQRVLYMLDLIK
ncbi:hypothetical protein J8037_001010 [Lactiplantibacillus plantarum]|uniref:hypothetical protein n=1 Tax=Lactiplantibacillus TaxID=2767842 RepID=UPI00254C276C|nr:hypothetical protein [Lactiplantibacillus argentoratensis]MDK9681536.1 hypothetical protein [Lactiplantibacillus argentoratensis]